MINIIIIVVSCATKTVSKSLKVNANQLGELEAECVIFLLTKLIVSAWFEHYN